MDAFNYIAWIQSANTTQMNPNSSQIRPIPEKLGPVGVEALPPAGAVGVAEALNQPTSGRAEDITTKPGKVP